jgi:inorganic pyrophosphatase/K(+)-stimulated pyrophosphate-energized sodium pump
MKQLMGALNRGIFGSSGLIVLFAAVVCYALLSTESMRAAGVDWWGVWLSIVAGLLAGIVIGKSTEYYTSYDYGPTRGVSRSAETGPATVIIAGIAEGMKSTWVALLTVIVAIVLAYAFAGGFRSMPMGLYGVGIAAVGMLATLGITLATDAYGPIADNAGGNAEMTHQEPQVRKRTDALDSLGNTTAAMGKGFAIGSAALTALALLAAYVEEVRVGQNREAHAAIAARYADAAKSEDAAFGKLLYLGHGKLAMKVPLVDRRGTKDERLVKSVKEPAFVGIMALTKLPKEMPAVGGEVEFKPIASDMPTTAAAGMPHPLGVPDEEKVYRIRIGKHEVQVVAAPEASLTQYMAFYDVTLMNPKVLCGMFAGVLLVFLFSAMTMKAVGRAAQAMVTEVRRQFKEIPGIMEGTGTPDYARCVAISTAGAQREMVVPSLLALIVPIAAGLLLDVGGVLGLLAGGLACGFAMAIFMANAGGAWDNAKKYIETGQMGGKGSANHKAAIVGDTVGDPFKDTSGPSLNILIKLMSMVSVVFAGLIVKYAPLLGAWLHLSSN